MGRWSLTNRDGECSVREKYSHSDGVFHLLSCSAWCHLQHCPPTLFHGHALASVHTHCTAFRRRQSHAPPHRLPPIPGLEPATAPPRRSAPAAAPGQPARRAAPARLEHAHEIQGDQGQRGGTQAREETEREKVRQADMCGCVQPALRRPPLQGGRGNAEGSGESTASEPRGPAEAQGCREDHQEAQPRAGPHPEAAQQTEPPTPTRRRGDGRRGLSLS